MVSMHSGYTKQTIMKNIFIILALVLLSSCQYKERIIERLDSSHVRSIMDLHDKLVPGDTIENKEFDSYGNYVMKKYVIIK